MRSSQVESGQRASKAFFGARLGHSQSTSNSPHSRVPSVSSIRRDTTELRTIYLENECEYSKPEQCIMRLHNGAWSECCHVV
ncbi:unnamed protein product [Dicrocoelium dendriticum]|nr:unnamed protein product [Dicrocoelium dendriticum]